MIFKDRSDAGRQLAAHLQEYKNRKDTLVLGLTRGGVVTAFEVAQALHLPLNIIVVRKIGAPGNEELALGAITETGTGIFNERLVDQLGVSQDYMRHIVQKEKEVAKERLRLYRGNCPPPDLKGKKAIVVDDGIATGASMEVAIHSVRAQGASEIILAVPVAAPNSLERLKKQVDRVVCLSSPLSFQAVGAFYDNFAQTSDDEIIHLLKKSNRHKKEASDQGLPE